MKPTILFVDDEVINLFVLKKRFENDYDVLTAESGEEALEVITKTNNLNAVISDFRMSGIDGIEFFNKAKESMPNTPFFLLTGYDYSEQIEEALSSGLVSSLFKKPFDYSTIHRTIQETLNGD